MIEVRRQFLPANEAEKLFDLRDSALRSAGLTVTYPVEGGNFVAGGRRATRSQTVVTAWRWIWLALMATWILFQIWKVARPD